MTAHRGARALLISSALVCAVLIQNPAGAAAPGGLAIQEYVNDGGGGHLWNAFNQTVTAQGPNITGRPSPITNGSRVQVFTRSDSGDLVSWVNDGLWNSTWNVYDLTTSAGSGGPILGSPVAASVGATGVDVFARSAIGHLVEYVNDGAGGHLWNAYDLTSLSGAGQSISGDPTAVVLGGLAYVFAGSATGALVEYANDGQHGKPWNAYDLTATASGGTPVQGDPSALVTGPGASGSGPRSPRARVAGRSRSAAGAAAGPRAARIQVFVSSVRGHLTEYESDGRRRTTWNANDLTAASGGGLPTGGSPVAVRDHGTIVHVYVGSATGHLVEYVSGGVRAKAWNAFDLTTVAGRWIQVQGDPSAIADNGGIIHVYITSTSGHLTEYVNDRVGGRVWNAYDLSSAAGGGATVGTEPTALLHGGSVHVYVGGYGAPEQPGWTTLSTGPRGIAIDERTFAQPDGSQVTVARFLANHVDYSLHVGSQDPPTGGALIGPDSGPSVGAAEQPLLLACLNGGFMANAGVGGFEVLGQVLVPLSTGPASFVIDTAGLGQVGVWGQDVPAPGEPVASVRQNLPPLVIGGQPSPQIGTISAWGATLGGGAYVARSALGQDGAGDVLYAASMSTVPADLANALVAAGATVAMQLDINPAWVQLATAATPGAPLVARVPGQNRPANQCQVGWSRDFIAVLSIG